MKKIILSLVLIFNLILTNIIYAEISIVAIVNGRPITSFELKEKIKLEKYLLKNVDATPQNTDEILKDFIDDKIKIEQATKMGVVIEKQDEQHTKTYFKHFFKLDDDFDKIPEKLNIDKKILDEKIKAEILWGKLVYGMLGSKVKITENDIQTKIKEITKDKKEFVYDIVPFIIGDDKQYDIFKNKISKIKTCDKFISFAKDNNFRGGTKISIAGSEMDTKLFNAIHNLQVNRISNKININGVDTIYFICDKKQFIPNFTPQEKEQIKIALFQEKLQKQGDDYFNKIKQSASIEIKLARDKNFYDIKQQNKEIKENFCPIDIAK